MKSCIKFASVIVLLVASSAWANSGFSGSGDVRDVLTFSCVHACDINHGNSTCDDDNGTTTGFEDVDTFQLSVSGKVAVASLPSGASNSFPVDNDMSDSNNRIYLVGTAANGSSLTIPQVLLDGRKEDQVTISTWHSFRTAQSVFQCTRN